MVSLKLEPRVHFETVRTPPIAVTFGSMARNDRVGRQGKTGAAGPRGPRGARGVTGATGRHGDTGVRGPKGLKGPRSPLHNRKVLETVVTHFEDVYHQLNVQMQLIAKIQHQLHDLIATRGKAQH